MAREPSPEIDDELFNEVYGKEYTGPPGSTTNNATGKGKENKRSFADDQSDEEDEGRDPNAVPTDFTSREAKVWDAKAKAIERNWKKRKEEEMICKICGEAGHFTQGCPSTLGANRKSADFFERVPAREKHVRALFSDKVINQIEKDVGCKIKMDEKFLIVSGKDRLILAKGVDAVHKAIQEGTGKKTSPASSNRTRSKSPDKGPMGSHLRRSESQRSHSSPRNTSRFQTRGLNHERLDLDNVRGDLQMLSRGSPQAYANDGAKGHSARLKSPLHPTFGGDAFSSYDGHNHNTVMHTTNSWDIERRETDSHSERKFDFPAYPQTLEELEMEFKREEMELGRIRDKEEDEENYKHRESIRELRENHMKKLAIMRGMHTKQWEEFLQLDIQRRQQARQNAYSQSAAYSADYGQPSQYMASSSLSPRSRYPYPYQSGENYSASKPHDDAYGDIPRQKRDGFGKAYGRY